MRGFRIRVEVDQPTAGQGAGDLVYHSAKNSEDRATVAVLADRPSCAEALPAGSRWKFIFWD
jgi:hypothetical protein